MPQKQIPNPPSNSNKDKKRKGKPNLNTHQKLLSLSNNLNPIPFKPLKVLDFSKHEHLFRILGLWDFVHLDFHNFNYNVSKDLLVQLFATYDDESHCSYVNGNLIRVSKPEFARVFKIPNNASVVGTISKEDTLFVSQFILHWVVLQDDDLLPPKEVMNWIKVVKDGYPEKVDWVGMIWLMVDKELGRGGSLTDCYFASHLQYLMEEQGVFSREGVVVGIDVETKEVGSGNYNAVKCQDRENGEKEEGSNDSGFSELDDLRKKNEKDQGLVRGKSNVRNSFLQRCGLEHGRELGEKNSKTGTVSTGFKGNGVVGDKFNVDTNDALLEEGVTGNVVIDEETKEVDGVNEGNGKAYDAVKCGVGPSIELTLGQDNETEEDNKESVVRVNKQYQWPMQGNSENLNIFSKFIDNDAGDHSLQRCGSENVRELGENSKLGTREIVLEENREAEDKVTYAGFVDGLTGNFLHSVEAEHGNYGQPDPQQMGSRPSFSYYSGNMLMGHDDSVMFSHALDDGNKSSNIYGPIQKKPLDFRTCKAREMMKEAGTLYQEKENALEQSHMHTNILLDEVMQRDTVVELLQKSRYEEIQKRDTHIYRYKKELIWMGKILDGYRHAMKDTKRAFDEFRKKAQETDNALEQSRINTQILLNEVQKRDAEIELLKKSRYEEIQKRDTVIELLRYQLCSLSS